MAEALLECLWPVYADPAKLVEQGDAWLASHAEADNAFRRIVIGNLEAPAARSRCATGTPRCELSAAAPILGHPFHGPFAAWSSSSCDKWAFSCRSSDPYAA
ncbi:MAG: hypothetical protein ACLUUF_00240 [Bifidobacterium pullorum]